MEAKTITPVTTNFIPRTMYAASLVRDARKEKDSGRVFLS